MCSIWYQSPPEVHANAAETLCTITRNSSSALAIKLSSPRFVLSDCVFLWGCNINCELIFFLVLICSFVARIMDHALKDSLSKSSLVHSLSVCISLLNPKRSTFPPPLVSSFRSQQVYEVSTPVNPDTIGAMLPKLGNSECFFCGSLL